MSHIGRLSLLNNKIDAIEQLQLTASNDIKSFHFVGNHLLDIPVAPDAINIRGKSHHLTPKSRTNPVIIVIIVIKDILMIKTHVTMAKVSASGWWSTIISRATAACAPSPTRRSSATRVSTTSWTPTSASPRTRCTDSRCWPPPRRPTARCSTTAPM